MTCWTSSSSLPPSHFLLQPQEMWQILEHVTLSQSWLFAYPQLVFPCENLCLFQNLAQWSQLLSSKPSLFSLLFPYPQMTISILCLMIPSILSEHLRLCLAQLHIPTSEESAQCICHRVGPQCGRKGGMEVTDIEKN